MARRRWPRAEDVEAGWYRRAYDEEARMPAGHVGRGGFGYPDGYHGAYEDRPGYWLQRGRLRGYGRGHHENGGVRGHSEERHRRALADRELAQAVDRELYRTVGPVADGIAVLADDAVITLEGRVPHPAAAREAVEAAWDIRGVRRVENHLRPGWR